MSVYLLDTNCWKSAARDERYVGDCKYINMDAFLEIIGMPYGENKFKQETKLCRLSEKLDTIKELAKFVLNKQILLCGRSLVWMKHSKNYVRNSMKYFLYCSLDCNDPKDLLKEYTLQYERKIESEDKFMNIFREARSNFLNSKMSFESELRNPSRGQEIDKFLFSYFGLDKINKNLTIDDFRECLYALRVFNVNRVFNSSCNVDIFKVNGKRECDRNCIWDLSLLFCCAFGYTVLSNDKSDSFFSHIYKDVYGENKLKFRYEHYV